MRRHPALLLSLSLPIAACSARREAPQDPGSPTPVAGPATGQTVAGTSGTSPAQRAIAGPDNQEVPVRADQAPLVHVLDALEVDSLLGRRVRVSGRCVAAGEGRRAGSWTLADSSATIEVRGLVPSSCTAHGPENLTIFAQIEPTSSRSQERLLLRLPD